MLASRRAVLAAAANGGRLRFASQAAAAAATTTPDAVLLSERAKERIAQLRKARHADALLRLSVEGGGCSGFSYKFAMHEGAPVAGEDVVFDDLLVVDATSLGFVKGAKVDFTEDLIRRSFEVVDNPQVETKCGCGTSFSPKGM